MNSDTITRHLRLESSESDGRTLTGLAVPFGSPTRIDSPWEGVFDEQFQRGAFKRSLGLRTPKLQFEHGTHPLFGSLPIGEFRSIKETDWGLEFEARIFDSELFAPLREAIASADAIDGVSIRFKPRSIEITDAEARSDDADVELRTVTEADLMELGPVVFPAYADTHIDLRNIDLNDKNDRRRLAEALVGAVATPDTGPVKGQAPSLDVTDSPADTDGQVLRHPSYTSRNRLTKHKEFYERWMSQS